MKTPTAFALSIALAAGTAGLVHAQDLLDEAGGAVGGLLGDGAEDGAVATPGDRNANGQDDIAESEEERRRRLQQEQDQAGAGDPSGNGNFGNNSSPTDGATATPGDRNGNGVDDITEAQREAEQ